MNSIPSVGMQNNYNVSCKARSLNFHQDVPSDIRIMVSKNPAVQRFINADKPNGLIQRFLNLFRKDKKLDVVYDNYFSSTRLGITRKQEECLGLFFGGKKKILKSSDLRVGNSEGVTTPSLQEQLAKIENLETELK